MFKKLAETVFNELLSYESVPDEYIHLVREILENPHYFRVDGAELFLYQIYASLDAVSAVQRNEVVEAIRINYPEYQRETMCLLATDFIARACAPEQAVDLLVQMHSASKTDGQRQAIAVAANVLAKYVNVRGKLAGELRRLLSSFRAPNS